MDGRSLLSSGLSRCAASSGLYVIVLIM